MFAIQQKLIWGTDPYVLRAFIEPILFGGSVGLMLALANKRIYWENRKLKQNNETLSALMNATTESIFLIDTNGNFAGINEVSASRLGYRPEELIGKCSFDLIPPELAGFRKKILAQIVENKQPFRHTDERAGLTYDNNIYPVVNSDGQVTHLAVFSRDITEQKQIEKQLIASETRFRGLIESTSDWIWAIDAKGFYTYASPKIREFLGYEPEEVIGKTPFDLMPVKEAERVRNLFNEIVAAQEPIKAIANENISKDGRKVVFETRGVPIYDTNGQLTGYQGVDRDITDRQAMELQREELIAELQTALAEIKQLQGFLPICAECKKIRDDQGYWQQIENYIEDRSKAKFSHSICPNCALKLYPEIYKDTSTN